MDREVTYKIQEAYRLKSNKHEAVEYVKKAFPCIHSDIIYAMWGAIDAYVDMEVTDG